MTTRVEIVEVSPRDGLQNEAELLSTQDKLSLISRAAAMHDGRIEVTSFVNPKRVPQMADADLVAQSLDPRTRARAIGLVLNERGFERAVAAGLREVNLVVVATDSFNLRNQGAPTADTLAAIERIAGRAREADLKVGVTIGAAFGCPFEGEVPLARLATVLEEVAAARPDEIALADTIGVASPKDVRERIGLLQSVDSDMPVRCHFHNTRNCGLANAVAAVESGATILDSSIGGIGGCPFAPAAAGNIPTEDLVYLLDRMGVETGVDLDQAIDAAGWLSGVLGRPVPGMLSRAGRFPPQAESATAQQQVS